MPPRRIVIAGGSGFIGTTLARHLAASGSDVVVLTRFPRSRGLTEPIRYVHWDGRTVGPWLADVDGAHAVVNLAGKSVNCRYTKKNLDEIDRSRVDAVRVMAAAVSRCATPPQVIVQASTTAIYGDAGDAWCHERTPPGDGIPVQTATQWEQAFEEAVTPGTRRVILRISFVLGRDGGVLHTLATLTRWFMGGPVGTGRQYISWIHIDDLIRVIDRAIDDGTMSGIYNVTSPTPVTNDCFMRELRRALKRPWSPRVPAALVRLGCFVIRIEPVLALTGRRVQPARLAAEGFTFEHTDLREALDAILAQPRAAGSSPPGGEIPDSPGRERRNSCRKPQHPAAVPLLQQGVSCVRGSAGGTA